MNILGISAQFHDAAAALVVDGQLVAAAAEERFSRLKHDAKLPLEAVDYCLAEAGLTIDDVDHVVFYEKPLRKFSRILETSARTFPRGAGQFVRAMSTWLGDRLWLERTLADTLGVDQGRLAFTDHHLSHAASAFLPSPFDSAAILTMDGVGERTTTALYDADTVDGRPCITPLSALHFPHSMGLVYSALTAYLGFRVNNGEYKVMGLAAYGEPRFVAELEQITGMTDEGTLSLDMSYFCFDRDPKRSFTAKLEDLLGPARAPDTPLEPGGVDRESRRFADVAASIQVLCERWVLTLAKRVRALTDRKNLCMAGGVALNSVANTRVAKEAGFERVYVHPAAGDDGGAVGAALYMSQVVLGEPRHAVTSALLGPALDSSVAEAELVACRVRHRRIADRNELSAEIARRLARGEVGALVSGRMEWGPRALGSRSIIADPRSESMRDRVNARVKFRERFRPFAPAVLASQADRYFELEPATELMTQYMLAVVPVTEAGREVLPAIRHVDNSARVQVVADDADSLLASVLTAFAARTGVGVVMNTSFNLKGEPICRTALESLSTFLRSDLDFLVLDDLLVLRPSAQQQPIADVQTTQATQPPTQASAA